MKTKAARQGETSRGPIRPRRGVAEGDRVQKMGMRQRRQINGSRDKRRACRKPYAVLGIRNR